MLVSSELLRSFGPVMPGPLIHPDLQLGRTSTRRWNLMEADMEHLLACAAEANRRGDAQALVDLHHPDALIIFHAQRP